MKGNTRLEIKRERDEFSESIQHREQKRRERARDDVQGVVIALRIRDLWNGDALQGGYRSMIAASMLKQRGYDNFVDLIGGFDDIKKLSIPKTEYVCPTTLL